MRARMHTDIGGHVISLHVRTCSANNCVNKWIRMPITSEWGVVAHALSSVRANMVVVVVVVVVRKAYCG